MDDDLQGKLDSWKVDSLVYPGFQREVWRRIAARRQLGWRQVLDRFLNRLASPRAATAALVAALALGAGIAHVDATIQNQKDWQALGLDYARSINPLEMASTHSPR